MKIEEVKKSRCQLLDLFVLKQKIVEKTGVSFPVLWINQIKVNPLNEVIIITSPVIDQLNWSQQTKSNSFQIQLDSDFDI